MDQVGQDLKTEIHSYFNDGKSQESTIDGHRAFTKVSLDAYGFFAAINTIIEIDNNRTLILFVYAKEKDDIKYYNDLISSLKFK